MLDIKFLRMNRDVVKQNIKNKFLDEKLVFWQSRQSFTNLRELVDKWPGQFYNTPIKAKASFQ